MNDLTAEHLHLWDKPGDGNVRACLVRGCDATVTYGKQVGT